MEDPKQALRAEAKKARDQIIPQSDDAQRVTDLFFEALKPDRALIIAGYMPTGREFDCLPILDEALKRGHQCALPKIINKDEPLVFLEWDHEKSMTENTYGILEVVQGEPIAPDIVLVPLLAFDRRGHRLGYGGGYYDRTLQALRAGKEIVATGIAYAQQACLFNLPAEEHDQTLDWVITPQDAHYFGSD